jgi:hypothetical protein
MSGTAYNWGRWLGHPLPFYDDPANAAVRSAAIPPWRDTGAGAGQRLPGVGDRAPPCRPGWMTDTSGNGDPNANGSGDPHGNGNWIARAVDDERHPIGGLGSWTIPRRAHGRDAGRPVVRPLDAGALHRAEHDRRRGRRARPPGTCPSGPTAATRRAAAPTTSRPGSGTTARRWRPGPTSSGPSCRSATTRRRTAAGSNTTARMSRPSGRGCCASPRTAACRPTRRCGRRSTGSGGTTAARWPGRASRRAAARPARRRRPRPAAGTQEGRPWIRAMAPACPSRAAPPAPAPRPAAAARSRWGRSTRSAGRSWRTRPSWPGATSSSRWAGTPTTRGRSPTTCSRTSPRRWRR